MIYGSLLKLHFAEDTWIRNEQSITNSYSQERGRLILLRPRRDTRVTFPRPFSELKETNPAYQKGPQSVWIGRFFQEILDCFSPSWLALVKAALVHWLWAFLISSIPKLFFSMLLSGDPNCFTYSFLQVVCCLPVSFAAVVPSSFLVKQVDFLVETQANMHKSSANGGLRHSHHELKVSGQAHIGLGTKPWDLFKETQHLNPPGTFFHSLFCMPNDAQP